jgi:hypothetical protein
MKLRYPIALIIVACSALGSEPVSEQFVQHGPKLVGSGAIGNAFQGTSVALSADGNTVIVGGDNDSNAVGAAWIWTRSRGIWTQQGAKLVGSGTVGNSFQGFSVALSADGNTAIVGGPSDNAGFGAAWVWTRSGAIWTQQGTKLVASDAVGNPNHQGGSVALSADGNTAIVGMAYANGGYGAAAWVWTRSGGVWTQGAKLVGSDAVSTGVYQGSSVSLSADGNTAIVGGPSDNNYAGAAWVWTRSGGVWTQQGTKLVGSGADTSEQGYAVSLSADGNTAVVGGPDDFDGGNGIARGAAWVWTRQGGVWTQQGPKLVGSGAQWEGVGSQGVSVSLSADGNTAIVGANSDQQPIGPFLPPTGAAWVWRRSGGIWIQQGIQFFGSDGMFASQGSSVSLSADGRTAIVGGPDAGLTGAAWIFDASDIPPRRRGVRH